MKKLNFLPTLTFCMGLATPVSGSIIKVEAF